MKNILETFFPFAQQGMQQKTESTDPYRTANSFILSSPTIKLWLEVLWPFNTGYLIPISDTVPKAINYYAGPANSKKHKAMDWCLFACPIFFKR